MGPGPSRALAGFQKIKTIKYFKPLLGRSRSSRLGHRDHRRSSRLIWIQPDIVIT